MPPETRAEQAKLFNNQTGDFKVLVASDAIGMGLNLQIKRVVFETMRKFDGAAVKLLSYSQVKQIAGRAGRFGSSFLGGLVTTLESSDMAHLHTAMAAPMTVLKVCGG